MDDILTEIRTSIAKIYASSITTKILKEEEANLARISSRPDFYQIFEALLSNQNNTTSQNVLLWATKEFQKVIRTNYSLISPENAAAYIQFLLEMLRQNSDKYEQFRTLDSLLESLIILFSKIYRQNNMVLNNASSCLSLKNFYKFLSLFPVVAKDQKIVIDDDDRAKFIRFVLYELLPQFLQSPFFKNQNFDSSDADGIIKLLSFYNNVFLFIQEEKNSSNQEDLIQLLNLTINISALTLALESVFSLAISEEAYDTIMQLIRTMSSFEASFDQTMPLFDNFIVVCYEHSQKKSKILSEIDMSIILKIISKLFQTFPEKLPNIEKGIVFLLEHLVKDSDTINSLLLGFKKFVKKISVSETRGNFTNLINVLWRKLPGLIELDENEFKENEKNKNLNEFSYEEDDSIYDYKYIRQNTRSLAKYLVYFLEDSDILPVLQSELTKIIRDFNSIRSIEAFSYLFNSIFTLLVEKKLNNEQVVKEKQLDKVKNILSNQNVLAVVLDIYLQLFSLLHHEWSIQVKINMLQMTTNNLVFFNSLTPIVGEEFFKSLKTLVEAADLHKNRKYEKYLLLSLEKCFIVIDETTLNSNREFISALVFTYPINSGLFKAVLTKLLLYWGVESICELTNKIINDIKLKFVPNKNFDEISYFLTRLKVIVETSTDALIQVLVFSIIDCVEFVMDNFYSNDVLSEKNCQVVFPLFQKISITGSSDSFLTSPVLESYLLKVLKYFQATYIPSYMYLMETFTHHFYTHQNFHFFKIYFEKINEIILNLVQPEKWEGHFIVEGNNRVKFSQKFSFLFDSNGLSIEDIFDDYFGYVCKSVSKNPQFFSESPNAERICRMVLNTFDNYFIYNVNTLVPLLFSILETNKENQSSDITAFWLGFWQIVIERSISLIFEESLIEKQIRKLIKLVSKINKKYQQNTVELIQKYISLISSTILTDNEKREFFNLITNSENSQISQKMDKLSIFTKKLIGRIREYRRNIIV